MSDHKIDQRIVAVRRRFGSKNPLLTLLLEWKVLAELQKADLDIQKLGRQVIDLATQLYGSSGRFVNVGKCGAEIKREPFHFLSKDYEQSYAGFWSEFRCKVGSDIQGLRGNSNVFSKFIYIVGPNGEWRFIIDPQPVSVSASGRRNAQDYPFHPFLASEFNFDVSSAGELSILWAPEDRSPRVFYINNISGHYKPTDLCASELLGIVLDCAPFLCDARILVVCNDAALLYSRAGGCDAVAAN